MRRSVIAGRRAGWRGATIARRGLRSAHVVRSLCLEKIWKVQVCMKNLTGHSGFGRGGVLFLFPLSIIPYLALVL